MLTRRLLSNSGIHVCGFGAMAIGLVGLVWATSQTFGSPSRPLEMLPIERRSHISSLSAPARSGDSMAPDRSSRRDAYFRDAVRGRTACGEHGNALLPFPSVRVLRLVGEQYSKGW